MRGLLINFFSALFLISASAQTQNQEAFMVVEANSGKVLVAANSGVARPVGNLTAITTAVIAVDWAEATQADLSKVMLTVPQVATMLPGPNPMSLQPGDQLTLRDALYSTMLGSDNFAALTIADHVGRQLLTARGKSGDPVAAFNTEMNELAKSLGMTHTTFVNPHGLETPHKVGISTAADMARISVYAMRRPALTFIVRQKDRKVSVQGSGGSRSFTIQNTNQLAGEPGIVGLKTGMTEKSGPCVAVAADREPAVVDAPGGQKKAVPRRLILILLNSQDRFNRARTLVGQGWGVYDHWVGSGAPIGNRQNEILDVPRLRE